MKKLSFKDYLDEAPLRSNYFLNDQKTINFHWANWKESCLYQKENLFKEGTQLKKLEGLYVELETLKDIIVWIKSSEKNLKTTMFDLYEFYLDSRVRLYWFSENSKVMFSMENEFGPYNTLSSKKWFNIDIYRAFLYRKILTKFMPYRSFRLGLNLVTDVYFDRLRNQHAQMMIHQISEHGVILKVMGKNDLKRFKKGHIVQLEIDLEKFNVSKNMNYTKTLDYLSLEENKTDNPRHKSIFILDTKLINFHSNDINTKEGHGSEYFIFASYEEFKNEHSILGLRDVFIPLIEKVEEQFKSEMK